LYAKMQSAEALDFFFLAQNALQTIWQPSFAQTCWETRRPLLAKGEGPLRKRKEGWNAKKRRKGEAMGMKTW